LGCENTDSRTATNQITKEEGVYVETRGKCAQRGCAIPVRGGRDAAYRHERTGNIVAPWLAHVLAGLALVLTEAMTFVQHVE